MKEKEATGPVPGGRVKEKMPLALYLGEGDGRRRVKRLRKSATMSADVFCRITAA